MKKVIRRADPSVDRARRHIRAGPAEMQRLAEDAPEQIPARHEASGRAFRLRPFKTRGGGFQPGFEGGNWERIRDEIHKGRGA